MRNDEEIKLVIEKVVRATMMYIRNQITREVREKIYDEAYDYIAKLKRNQADK